MKLHNIVDNRYQCNTITVNDLIRKLQEYSPNMPVIGVWDHNGFPVCNVTIANNYFFKETVVALNVSHMFYKDGDEVVIDY
jgi:hypothetical protein